MGENELKTLVKADEVEKADENISIQITLACEFHINLPPKAFSLSTLCRNLTFTRTNRSLLSQREAIKRNHLATNTKKERALVDVEQWAFLLLSSHPVVVVVVVVVVFLLLVTSREFQSSSAVVEILIWHKTRAPRSHSARHGICCCLASLRASHWWGCEHIRLFATCWNWNFLFYINFTLVSLSLSPSHLNSYRMGATRFKSPPPSAPHKRATAIRGREDGDQYLGSTLWDVAQHSREVSRYTARLKRARFLLWRCQQGVLLRSWSGDFSTHYELLSDGQASLSASRVLDKLRRGADVFRSDAVSVDEIV